VLVGEFLRNEPNNKPGTSNCGADEYDGDERPQTGAKPRSPSRLAKLALHLDRP